MRGVKGSRSSKDEKRKRGISNEQFCVLNVYKGDITSNNKA
ncbi:hypothetical protein [Clostridium estertheticum]|nr:hypothetical protein [Clostridium estertheticum]